MPIYSVSIDNELSSFFDLESALNFCKPFPNKDIHIIRHAMDFNEITWKKQLNFLTFPDGVVIMLKDI